MTKKQITFTTNEADTAYVMVVEEKDFAEKKEIFEKGEPKDVPAQEYAMFKTTKEGAAAPVSQEEVATTFGTADGNKILEFVFHSSK